MKLQVTLSDSEKKELDRVAEEFGMSRAAIVKAGVKVMIRIMSINAGVLSDILKGLEREGPSTRFTIPGEALGSNASENNKSVGGVNDLTGFGRQLVVDTETGELLDNGQNLPSQQVQAQHCHTGPSVTTAQLTTTSPGFANAADKTTFNISGQDRKIPIPIQVMGMNETNSSSKELAIIKKYTDEFGGTWGPSSRIDALLAELREFQVDSQDDSQVDSQVDF